MRGRGQAAIIVCIGSIVGLIHQFHMDDKATIFLGFSHTVDSKLAIGKFHSLVIDNAASDAGDL